MRSSSKKTTNYLPGSNETEGYSLPISGCILNYKISHSKTNKIGGLSLGIAGGSFAPLLCVALGFSTLGIGAISCSVITSLAGSTAGSVTGEIIGKRIYEATNDK